VGLEAEGGWGMKMKYRDDITVVGSHCSAMSMCRCGAVFEASGTSAEVRRLEDEWNAQHICKREEPKTFWLSFCDPTRPTGEQFLGVCIVDVTQEDADEALLDVVLNFPCAQEGAHWIGAASRKAHREGCNPGGEMASMDITGVPSPVPLVKNQLLSFADLERLGLQPISEADLEADGR